MTSKKRNTVTCLAIILLIIFIYTPLRTGKLEQQFIKSVVSSTEKIVISISSFEKSKRLRDKDLSKFYTIIKDKYPIALIAAADKKNKILKAGKNEKFIKSNKSFDSIIDSFIRDAFRIDKKNDFIIKYYDQSRFYIFVRYITDGKILLVYPYKLSTKLIIQLLLEILLISITAIIITAAIFIYKERKFKNSLRIDSAEKPEKIQKNNNEKAGDEKKITKTEQRDEPKPDIDSLSSHIYGLFSYIYKEYKSETISFYLLEKDSSRLNKIFELKRNAFIKIENAEFNSISMNSDIIEELKNSSIILLEKGKRVTVPILYRNALLGIINITRDKEFKGPEINDIKRQLKIIEKPVGEYILLSEMRSDENASAP